MLRRRGRRTEVQRRSVALWTEGSWRTTSWLGGELQQLPQDLLALQEVVYEQRPSVIVETGLFGGGSALFYATLLHALGGGRVISVEKGVRPEARAALDRVALGRSVHVLEGDSKDPAVVAKVRQLVGSETNVLVALDADHSRDHVLAEMEAYAPLVPPGGWLVVFDGVMAWIAEAGVQPGFGESPEWLDDNPLAAIKDFLAGHPEFEVTTRNERLGATFAPCGFLRRRQS